jgi:hypothetical protein
VLAYASSYNEKRFRVPLPYSEVKDTAKSIANLTIGKMAHEGFTLEQIKATLSGENRSQGKIPLF